MKDHFLDNWANLKSATQIAELFDNYEDVRKVNSKLMDRWGRNDKILTYSGVKEKENRFGKTSPRLGASVPESTRERTFEKRVIQRCYHCNMPGHIKAVCPKLIKNKTTETLNNIEGYENPDFLNSYTTKGSVNGHEIDILRDTGATIDLVCAKYINPSSFSVEILNAVQTRSQVKAARAERGIDSGDAKKGEDEVIIVSSDAEDEILIPALQEYVPELALLRVTRENLINAQKIARRLNPYTNRQPVKCRLPISYTTAPGEETRPFELWLRTRTSPSSPTFLAILTGGRLRFHIFDRHATLRDFGGTRLELVTRQPRVRDLDY
ncbi:retrovirus-related Pol polyprotein from transposon 17.6 [Trichonephila clavipes]|uniref:Retrovirus-related Pol polyprotein from transposon 17.6 n=1 Tax=Trichonephila clavipes TaxID=2585209 RepID=A0A8X6RTT6_TRICX|nr:retrovirus-related Pol polyprotein from transposon 17.6 [Trichonephila clavipes]